MSVDGDAGSKRDEGDNAASKFAFAEPDSREKVDIKVDDCESLPELKIARPEGDDSKPLIDPPPAAPPTDSVPMDLSRPSSPDLFEKVDDGDELPAVPPGLPGLRGGLLSLLAVIVACIVYLVQFFQLQDSFSGLRSWPAPPALYFLLAAWAAHFAWIAYCRHRLLRITSNLLAQDKLEPRAQEILLGVLPFSWLALVYMYFSQGLFLLQDCLPVVHVMPFLLVVSWTYWFGSMLYWPRKLSKFFTEQINLRETAPEAPKSSGSLLGGILGFSGKSLRFPRLYQALLMLPLAAVPYVWYWRKCTVAAYRAKYPQAQVPMSFWALVFPQLVKEEVGPEKSKRPGTSSKLVVRYRRFAALERWIRQRFGNSDWRHFSPLRKALAYLAAPFLVLAAVWVSVSLLLFSLPILSKIGLSGNGVAQQAPSILSLSTTNHGVLAVLASLCFGAVAFGVLYLRRQPTHYEFGSQGFRSFRWNGPNRVFGPLTTWSAVKHIGLTGGGNPHLRFDLKDGSAVKLNLGSIESIEDRENVLNAIERWAPAVSRDMDAVQALQPPVDHSYTELWLQALAAPPERDRLKPLIRDMVIGEGRYKVRGALGVGGQGVAYEALDHNSGETVVLKEFLLPIYVDVSVRKDVLERFEGEAKILKKLDHPQVVKLSDFFIEDHRAYLVLEHIDGVSLRDTVAKEGKLSEERVRKLAVQMCEILKYLHSQTPAVVHRDFTPENLILRSDGLLKLIDFNVARQVESTATGSVVGKPAYLPPEQFRGQPVTQSDIYGMGATLHFLLTGEDPEPINVSHPRALVPGLSSSIDSIVARATAVEIEDRYEDWAEVLKELEKPVVDEPEPAAPEAEPAVSAPEMTDSDTASISHSASVLADAARRKFAFLGDAPEEVHLREASAGSARDGTLPDLKVADEGATLFPGPVSRDASGSPAAPSPARMRQYGARILRPFVLLAGLMSILTLALALSWLTLPSSIYWFDSKPVLHSHWLAFWQAKIHTPREVAIGLSELNKCIEIDPNFAPPYLMRSFTHIKGAELDLEKMAADLDKVIALKPNDKFAHTMRGKVYAALERYREAVTDLKAGLELKYDEPIFQFFDNIYASMVRRDLELELAYCYLHCGQGDNAAREYKEYLSYDPWSPDRDLPVIIEEQRHEPLAASKALTAAMESARVPKGPLLYGSFCQATLKKALVDLRGDERADSAMWALCEGLSYSRLGEAAKAVDLYSQGVSLRPDFADSYAWRADGYIRLDKFDLALADLDKALALEPGNLMANYLRGRCLQMQKNYDAALKQYAKVQSLLGKDCGTLALNLGLCKAAQGDYKAALDYYSKVPIGTEWYHSDETETTALVARSIAYYRLGQYRSALLALDDANRRYPYNLRYSLKDLRASIEQARDVKAKKTVAEPPAELVRRHKYSSFDSTP